MRINAKYRVPGKDSDPKAESEATSSTTTRAELKALETFRGASSEHAPHLVHYKQAIQGPSGPLPGGYLTYTVMTKMPGDSLHNLYYWGMPTEEREVIVKEFLVALRYARQVSNLLAIPLTLNITQVDLCHWHRTHRLRVTECFVGG